MKTMAVVLVAGWLLMAGPSGASQPVNKIAGGMPRLCLSSTDFFLNWPDLPYWVQASWLAVACYPELGITGTGQVEFRGARAVWAQIVIPSKEDNALIWDAVYIIVEAFLQPAALAEKKLLEYRTGKVAFGEYIWVRVWQIPAGEFP